ncbi:MAG: PPC domain-containing protein [Blastocatellia bacterium]|nr:PPC domain-containing protein [Blastocatellia bacterium]
MASNTRTLLSLVLVLCCAPDVIGQSSPDAQSFGPEKPVERAISGAESHTYRVALTAGQFVLFRLDQRSLDCGLVLSAPDGKQLAEMDFTGTGEQESLAIEAVTTGDHRLTVQSNPAASWLGSYRLEATIHTPASASDRKQLVAQA